MKMKATRDPCTFEMRAMHKLNISIINKDISMSQDWVSKKKEWNMFRVTKWENLSTCFTKLFYTFLGDMCAPVFENQRNITLLTNWESLYDPIAPRYGNRMAIHQVSKDWSIILGRGGDAFIQKHNTF